ncbi:MAG TPA: ABC transporter permease [Vicinamibacterales bacterium]|jgi:putative ABC transport system permease protein|nr:ABC transporter permease [Vicinamibacterales bacterium]
MNLRELASRIAGALGRGRSDREIAADLAAHRDELEAFHLRRGLTAEEARRAVRFELGGEVQALEAVRDQRSLPFVDALRQDLRYGLRMLRRAPGFTAAAVLTLAIGIGANTAIFSVVDAVLLRPLPYADPDRLVSLGERTRAGDPERVGYATFIDWEARSRSFESLAVMRSFQPTLVVNGEAERLAGVRVTWSYFEMLGVRPALGRTFTQEEDRPDAWHEVVLSDGLWRRRFGGDPTIVGRTVVMNDLPYRVVGVMPASFPPLISAKYYTAAEIWAPLGYAVGVGDSCRDCRHLRAFGRLRPGVSAAAAAAEMTSVHEQLRAQYPTQYEPGSVAVVPLGDAITAGARPQLLLLLGAVACVLVIACANVANLLLARSELRRRELALRVVLGAGRRRIAAQLLTETALLSAIGGACGLLLAAIAMRGVSAVAPQTLPRLGEVGIDLRVALFACVVVIVAAALVALAPIRQASRDDLRGQLAVDSRTTAAGAGRVRALLVVADLAIALTLLAGAAVMLRSVTSLARVNPGFDPNRILSMRIILGGRTYAEDPAVRAYQTQAIEHLRALPGVAAVALADQIPFGGDFDCRGFHVQGRMKPNAVDDPCIQRYGTTPAYLSVMSIPLKRGRFFTAEDGETSQPVAVVSESTARLVWGTADPIGSVVRIGSAVRGPWCTIVGVVGDVRHEDLAAPPIPAVYMPESQSTDSFLVALVKSSSDAAALAPSAIAAVRQLDPSVPVYGAASVAALVNGAIGERLFVMRLLAGFAAVGLLLAAVGLYGLVAYGVSQRTREVGLRLALGATSREVLRLLLSKGVTLLAAGLAAGVAGAVLTTRLLGSLVFGVSPLDPLAFGGAALTLVAVAVAAHVIPAIRALRIDPALALRHD